MRDFLHQNHNHLHPLKKQQPKTGHPPRRRRRREARPHARARGPGHRGLGPTHGTRARRHRGGVGGARTGPDRGSEGVGPGSGRRRLCRRCCPRGRGLSRARGTERSRASSEQCCGPGAEGTRGAQADAGLRALRDRNGSGGEGRSEACSWGPEGRRFAPGGQRPAWDGQRR